MNRMLYRIFNAAYFSFQNHSLDEQQWQRFRDIVCGNHTDVGLASLWSRTVTIVSSSFASYLDENCGSQAE